MARTDDVRDPVQHGPDRLADRPDRRAALRLALRRRQHADHDPHGQAPCSRCSAPTARSCPACTRSARRCAPGRQDVPWPCNADRRKYIVHFPEERAIWSLRLRLRRQRAARQEVPGAAHRLGAWRRDEGWLAEHMLIMGVTGARAARRPTSARPFPAPAARPTSRCSCRPRASDEAGRSPRSATTSPGSSRAPTAALRASTRKRGSSASRPAPTYAVQPQRDGSRSAKLHLHQRRADRRRRRLVGGHDRRDAKAKLPTNSSVIWKASRLLDWSTMYGKQLKITMPVKPTLQPNTGRRTI